MSRPVVAASDGGNAIMIGCFGTIGIEFDAGQVSGCVFGDFDQRRTVTGAGIDGCIRR